MVQECPGIHGVFSTWFRSQAEPGLCLPEEVYVHCVLFTGTSPGCLQGIRGCIRAQVLLTVAFRPHLKFLLLSAETDPGMSYGVMEIAIIAGELAGSAFLAVKKDSSQNWLEHPSGMRRGGGCSPPGSSLLPVAVLSTPRPTAT